MKKETITPRQWLIVILIILMTAVHAATAQTIIQGKGKVVTRTDSSDNFRAINAKDSITGLRYVTSAKDTFPLLQGSKGGIYYWKQSRSGKMYKVYVKL